MTIPIDSSFDQIPFVVPQGRWQHWLTRQCRKLMFRRLQLIQQGHIRVVEAEQEWSFGQTSEPSIALIVHDPRFYSDIVLSGSIGAGESFMAGRWSCQQLTDLLRTFVCNRAQLDDFEGTAARLQQPLRRFLHWCNRNHMAGSQKNIGAHYDLGNDLFALMLDQRMMYSAGLFTKQDGDLERAAKRKNQRIIHQLDLKASDHLLEIGTGWGGFAIQAAQSSGCRVTTTTISDQQYQWAKQRIEALGLTQQITLLKKDYRQLEGQFDKLVSIEMFEAVGHQYFDVFFKVCRQRLISGGRMVLQSITIADELYQPALHTVDFIQRYIFPGGCLPSKQVLNQQFAQQGFRISDCKAIGKHYQQTLACWRQRFVSQLERVRQLGYSEQFIRMWLFYLCYCEAGFAEDAIDNVQITAEG